MSRFRWSNLSRSVKRHRDKEIKIGINVYFIEARQGVTIIAVGETYGNLKRVQQ
jgi:hypothetical protein